MLARAPYIASLALVSVLHTSVAAWAQAPQPPAGNASASTAPAAAPEISAASREQARAAYGAGQEAFGAGQYAVAEAHFARADTLMPAIQAKYWRAMSLDKLGDVAGAFAAFGLVLADPKKDELGAEKVETAAMRQRALGSIPADLQITTTPAGAHVQVSGVDLASPTPLALRLAPGRHVLVVSLPGYQSQSVELNATAGAKLRPAFTLVPQLAPAAPPATTLSPPPTDVTLGSLDAPTARSLVPGYVTLGIAGASAIVGTIFGIRALGNKDDFNDAPSTRRADDVERNALIADMAFGVTLTLGITGVVLLLADEAPQQAAAQPATEQAGVRLTPYVSPRGAGAAATLTF
ncbi:MAG: hypothetical protein RL685_6152 [Pseudomonadota bacterium]